MRQRQYDSSRGTKQPGAVAAHRCQLHAESGLLFLPQQQPDRHGCRAGAQGGFRVDEKTAAQQVKANAGALSGVRDLLHQGTFRPGTQRQSGDSGVCSAGPGCGGLQARPQHRCRRDVHPDAPDGGRPLGLRSRSAASAVRRRLSGKPCFPCAVCNSTRRTCDKAAFAKSIQLAATWIGEFQPRTNYDLAWRLQGLVWGGKSKDAILKARRDLLAVQRADGGWSDMPSMESSAYTTGLAMIALQSSGLPVSDPAYQRGVQYLLSTQLEDGRGTCARAPRDSSPISITDSRTAWTSGSPPRARAWRRWP